MEGGGEGDDHMRVPLLLSEDGGKINEYGRERCCRNSVASLKCDFFSKLPEKVRSGLDPETPFHLDLSKTTGLIEGTKNSLFLCLWCLVSLFFFFLNPPPPQQIIFIYFPLSFWQNWMVAEDHIQMLSYCGLWIYLHDESITRLWGIIRFLLGKFQFFFNLRWRA